MNVIKPEEEISRITLLTVLIIFWLDNKNKKGEFAESSSGKLAFWMD